MLVSVIVPVKDGARYLAEVLAAIGSQELDAQVETLVIDSGSSDGSVAIAAAAGARVIEIAPGEFGHGRTRNFAAEQAAGDVLVFLTQDATPASARWLHELIAPIDVEERVGLAFGPHLPRPGTSPMVARELEQFFGSFSPDGSVRVDRVLDAGDPASGFFSNVNSCIARRCWEDVRFPDVAYSEDQAFARAALAKGWSKAFVPAAGVLHAHDYPFAQFMRRYFDEYRGLRESVGHVEPAGLRRAVHTTREQVAGDLTYMKSAGWSRGKRAGWGVRSARHHLGRSLFSALGSRSERLPSSLARGLSLEDRAGGSAAGPQTRHVDPRATEHGAVRLSAAPAAPLAPASPHDGGQPSLHVAWVIPPFRRGSGGHMTLLTLARGFEERGHSCSIWIHDPTETMHRREAVNRREIVKYFVPVEAGVFRGFDDWHGADVAIATGWQTAYPLRALDRCKLKAYLVQDFEPEFYPASVERMWAEDTYRMGFPASAASPWLRDLLRSDYGAQAEAFDLGVDFDIYKPQEVEREPATIVFYARPATPRRATELGLLALAELAERRPQTRFVLFGDTKPPRAGFPYEFAGVADERDLAALYNSATVGLVLSLTNYSRIPKEMMACGLPVVDLKHPSVLSVFGEDESVIALADLDPTSIANRLEALLSDPAGRAAQADAARRFVQGMTWDAASEQVEAHVRAWLAERWERAGAALASR